MAIELKVPTVGESITEVQIGEWLKGEGDRVERDEILVKIETDKVTVDLPAPSAGVLSRIAKKQGEAAAVVGQVDDVGGQFRGVGRKRGQTPFSPAHRPIPEKGV